MLRSVDDIKGYTFLATDGEIGRVKDVLFDDREWTVRYLVADTRKWLPGRKVLISPVSVRGVDEGERALDVNLSKHQIETGPPLDEHQPVSRRHEIALAGFFPWPQYWGAPGPYPLTGRMSAEEPTGIARRPASRGEMADLAQAVDESVPEPALRSTNEVVNYRIHAVDGEIGHVDTFIIDTGNWLVRYFVVDTRNWLPGRKVLLAPEWCEGVDWAGKTVSIALTKEQVQNSPQCDPARPINEELQTRLFEYYRGLFTAKS
ncbi:MAG: PRC-barrel domain-containing protein [Planctomycetota bacterium]|nr:PRC-barrel domain-containing protein [Planctomycetota bacterium]